jgi:hypothetical protein
LKRSNERFVTKSFLFIRFIAIDNFLEEKMKKLLFPILLLTPIITKAALVPCGKKADGNMCTLCDLIVGIQSLTNYLLGIMVVLAILAITIGGILYIVSAGTPALTTMAKAAIKNALIGIAICLLAFLIITTVMSVLAAKDNLGVSRATNWYTFTCAGGVSSNEGTKKEEEEKKECKEKKLDSIEIQCEEGTAIESVTLEKENDTFQLKAIGKYTCDNGETTEEDVTQTAKWDTADQTVAKAENGLVKGIASSGETSATASLDSASSSAKVYVGMCLVADNDGNTNQLVLTELVTQEKVLGVNSAKAAGCKGCKKQTKGRCTLIQGSKNATKIFIISRSDFTTANNTCNSPLKWDANNAQQKSKFEKTVSDMSGGVGFLNYKDEKEFAVYRSDKIYGKNELSKYAVEKECAADIPNMNNGPVYISFIQNGEGKWSADDGRAFAYAKNPELPAFYCVEQWGLDAVFAHEQLGHQFAGLVDEYEDQNIAKNKNGMVYNSFNCTKDSKCSKWKADSGGCVEGCLYMNKGAYRSDDNSIMRNHLGCMGQLTCGIITSAKFSAVQKKVIHEKIVSFPNFPKTLNYLQENITITP